MVTLIFCSAWLAHGWRDSGAGRKLHSSEIGALETPSAPRNSIVGQSDFLIDPKFLPHDASSRYRRVPVNDDVVTSPAELLGKGYSGHVVAATERRSGRRCAVKTYRKCSLARNETECLRSEASIHLQLGYHPHIVELFGVYETREDMSIVTELCTGGQLFNVIEKAGGLAENIARRVTRQMLSAIDYIHQRGIVHRDIKLENWLLASGEGDAPIKLIDFGFASPAALLGTLVHRSGTLEYMAPEALQFVYGEKADMWSLGVTVFVLLTGRYPFSAPSKAELAAAILGGDYAFAADDERGLPSALAGDFVGRLLALDPDDRMSAAEGLRHPWIVGSSGWELGNPPQSKEFAALKAEVRDVGDVVVSDSTGTSSLDSTPTAEIEAPQVAGA